MFRPRCARALLVFAATLQFAFVAASPAASSQHAIVGPWYIASDHLWDEYEVFDSHSDGGGGGYTVYKNYQVLPGNVSQIRLLRPPSADVDVLNIPNLSDAFFRVVDQGPGRAWIGRLDLKSGRMRVLLHVFDLLGKEFYHQGGLLLSGTASVTSFVLRRAPDRGVYACWWDDSTPAVQCVDKNGTPLWGDTGLTLRTRGPAGSSVAAMNITAAAGGGIVAAWIENAPAGGERLLCAQRVRQDGTIAWASDAVIVDRAPGDISLRALCADAGGGAFLHWERDSTLLLQHIDGTGAPLLDAAGAVMGLTSDDPFRVKSDGQGGILISDRISVRKVASDHSEPWPGHSVVFAADAAPGTLAEVSPDGKGGAFVVWNMENWATGIQWIDSTGLRRWGNGLILLALSGETLTVLPSPEYASPAALFSVQTKGVFTGRRYFFTIADTLSRIATGAVPAPAPIGHSLSVSPSPVDGVASVGFMLERPASIRIDVVDILGRCECTLVEAALPAGSHTVIANFSSFSRGFHFLVMNTGSETVATRVAVVH